MAAENDFLLFANDASNIESQADYDVDTAVVNGFSSGTASSAQFNKVFRQATTAMALLASFIQQEMPNQTVLDQGQGGLPTLLSSLTQALGVLLRTQPIVQTNESSSTGTTLTAAMLLGFPMAYIDRSGPTAAFTDTTDTAADILTSLGGGVLNAGFIVRILNTTAYAQTIAGGTGVTMEGTATIAAGTWREYVGQITDVATPTITFTSQGSGST